MLGPLEIIWVLGKPALLASEFAGLSALRGAVTKFLPLGGTVIGQEKTAAVRAPPFFDVRHDHGTSRSSIMNQAQCGMEEISRRKREEEV